MAFSDSLFYIDETMVDYAVWRFYLFCCIDSFFDPVLGVVVFGCFFGFSSDEYIEV